MGLRHYDFKSGLDAKPGVLESGKLNIIKTFKSLRPKKLGCEIRGVVKSGDENVVVHCSYNNQIGPNTTRLKKKAAPYFELMCKKKKLFENFSAKVI